MKLDSLNYLECPKCHGHLILNRNITDNKVILNAKLKCQNSNCRSSFQINEGLADLIVDNDYLEKKVVSSFGYEWGLHLNNKLEKKTVFVRNQEKELDYFFTACNISPNFLKNKVILDAGCGSGKLTLLLNKYQPKFIFGIDIHSGLLLASEATQRTLNCEIVRADIFNPPFNNRTFDIVWCNGVIHHTPNPYLAFNQLAKLVKKRGRLYVWIYEKRFSPFKITKDLFRLSRLDRLPYPFLLLISRLLALISYFLLKIVQLGWILFKPKYKDNYFISNIVKKRTYNELVMTWFDSLSPKYDFRFREDEVKEWFKSTGFSDLTFQPNKIGICGIKK